MAEQEQARSRRKDLVRSNNALGEEWTKVRDAVGTLEYVSQDVTDQASAFLLLQKIDEGDERLGKRI